MVRPIRLLALTLLVYGIALAGSYPPGKPPMKNDDPEVPTELQEGRATLELVMEWSRSFNPEDVPPEHQDIDCDDQDEVFVEILMARGATGNRWFLAFDQGDDGYRYLGTALRILGTHAFGEECYVIQYANAGGGEYSVGLYDISDGDFVPVGGVMLEAGDQGNTSGQSAFELLRTGKPTRGQVLEIFGKQHEEN